jgi:hypothetical protein
VLGINGTENRVKPNPSFAERTSVALYRALLRSGDYTKVQVADELEDSCHTLWRALMETAK